MASLRGRIGKRANPIRWRCSWLLESSSGNGAVAFSVAPNPGAARTGTISIAGQTVTVRQAAAPVLCSYAISPPSASLAAAGGTGSLAVTTGDGCNWTASSGAAWVAITSDISGSGNGAVTFSVAPNSGAARTGTVSIAGQTVTVNQEAAPPPCTYSIAQPNGSFGALGGTGTVSISTGAGCAWRATSNAAWIVVTAGANSTGSGAVGFSVLVNLLGARTGTLTVAGETFTVNQAGVLGDLSGQIVSTRQEH